MKLTGLILIFLLAGCAVAIYRSEQRAAVVLDKSCAKYSDEGANVSAGSCND